MLLFVKGTGCEVVYECKYPLSITGPVCVVVCKGNRMCSCL